MADIFEQLNKSFNEALDPRSFAIIHFRERKQMPEVDCKVIGTCRVRLSLYAVLKDWKKMLRPDGTKPRRAKWSANRHMPGAPQPVRGIGGLDGFLASKQASMMSSF